MISAFASFTFEKCPYPMQNSKFQLVFLLLCCSVAANSQLRINELMAANAGFEIETDFYNFSDWLEIFNTGSESLYLRDYYLSDNAADPLKWRLPGFTLPGKAYYVVYCDKEDYGNHTNFGLRMEGESLYLSDASGKLIDQLDFEQQYPNISYGRDPSEPDKLLYCTTPTPGSPNSPTSASEQGDRVDFSVLGYRLDDPAELSLTGTNVRYTTDGSDPIQSSTLYSEPLSVHRTLVVKAKTFEDGYLPGETSARTYFYKQHEFTLPLVSLSFNHEYFYDDMIGIHVRGTNGTAGNCGGIANYNQDWERPAYFEYFDQEGARRLSQPVGVKIAGGCTRGRDQKSLSIYARGKYGDNDFDFPVFIEKDDINEFSSLLLRNSGNDQDQTLLRDAFLQALVKPSMDIDYQSYQPTIVYFNGQYRGIMNLREKTDEDYFQSNYFISSGEIDFLENDRKIIRGSADDYTEIVNFLTQNSLVDDDKYSQVVSKIDLQEYINWLTINLYIGNRDWPGNNIKFWKKQENGKWRWLLFDLDYGFGFRMDAQGYMHESFEFATATDGSEHPNPPWSTLLLRKLLENESFRKQFLSTYLTHVYSSFEPAWCNEVLDSLSTIIDSEIYYNQIKYERTKSQWEAYLDELKLYAVNRHGFMPDYVKDYFNLSSDEVVLTVFIPDTRKGKVKVNEALIQRYPLELKTYKELPMLLEAIPGKGYRFDHWMDRSTGDLYSESRQIRSDSTLTLSLEPVFEVLTEGGDIHINEVAAFTTSFHDEFGEKSGFIELFNPSGEEAILHSWFLSDKSDNLTLFAIPDSTLIPPGGFLIIYADGEARQGPLHTSFRMNPDGEQVYLSQKVGEQFLVKDSVYFEYLLENNSYGRFEDGTGTWIQMAIMTPGQPNEPFQVFTNPVFSNTDPLFEVYPNPAADHLFIKAEGLDPHSEKYFIELFDVTGKMVVPRTRLTQSKTLLDVTWIDAGLYIVRILTEKAPVHTSRIVVIK